MGLLSRLFDPDGSSRAAQAVASVQQQVTADSDSVDALLGKMRSLILEINSSAADLPAIGVVLARAVTDTIREVLTGGDASRLDIGVRVAINGTLTDYLPGTIRAYVGAVRAAGPQGEAAATDALVEQLTTLRRSVEELAAAGRQRDLSALQVQGRFLQDKFGQSELDI
ncbi:hypothetical protein [Flexivirga meconopsidis]|uniref:hypothetical protein n=1 Tax=Flexivirga meconopsidis TaxID=2977121 RepID=UPI00223EFB27|nr:hypothetical protein [Flexivirga meconopsidis]